MDDGETVFKTEHNEVRHTTSGLAGGLLWTAMKKRIVSNDIQVGHS
jgi:hypothetical protein